MLKLYRCTVCDTRWLLWPAGVGGTRDASWNLLDHRQKPGAACCDNVAMNDIEFLRDLPLTVTIQQPASPVAGAQEPDAWKVPFRRMMDIVCMCGDTFDSIEAFIEHGEMVHADEDIPAASRPAAPTPSGQE